VFCDVNSEFFDLVPEYAFRDAEQFGGMALDAIGPFEGIDDQLLFDVPQSFFKVALRGN
jgi:hypothetical protein